MDKVVSHHLSRVLETHFRWQNRYYMAHILNSRVRILLVFLFYNVSPCGVLGQEPEVDWNN